MGKELCENDLLEVHCNKAYVLPGLDPIEEKNMNDFGSVDLTNWIKIESKNIEGKPGYLFLNSAVSIRVELTLFQAIQTCNSIQACNTIMRVKNDNSQAIEYHLFNLQPL